MKGQENAPFRVTNLPRADARIPISCAQTKLHLFL
jgi:hypothetical protein